MPNATKAAPSTEYQILRDLGEPKMRKAMRSRKTRLGLQPKLEAYALNAHRRTDVCPAGSSVPAWPMQTLNAQGWSRCRQNGLRLPFGHGRHRQQAETGEQGNSRNCEPLDRQMLLNGDPNAARGEFFAKRQQSH